MNQFHIHGYIICLTVKAQIHYMRFLKEFKMSEILCVNTFDIITLLPISTQCVYVVPWKIPCS
jgi:hypothetical protein